MACNLKPNVGYGPNACIENFSGVGGEAFIFLKDDLEAAPVYETTENKNEFTSTSFTFKNAKGAYRIKLKKQVNSVTWSNNPNSGGYTVTATFIVADDMDSMAFNGRTLNNLGGDWGVMIPAATSDGTSRYYVIYNHDFGLSTFTVEGTTGDAPDSDHGHTYTVAATMFYGPTMWTGTLNTVSEEGNKDNGEGETENQ
jgi:hypothetical protein